MTVGGPLQKGSRMPFRSVEEQKKGQGKRLFITFGYYTNSVVNYYKIKIYDIKAQK